MFITNIIFRIKTSTTSKNSLSMIDLNNHMKIIIMKRLTIEGSVVAIGNSRIT
jgi:hypothetical protein